MSRRSTTAAARATVSANHTRNSQLLAGYAANPSSIPQPGPAKGTRRHPLASTSPTEAGPPPFDAGLEASNAANIARRATLSSDADVDLQQTSQEYGFKYDPSTGAFGGFDPTNPFSQAALLLKTRTEATAGTTNSYASRGQQYSGAVGRAQTEVQSQYDKGYDTLRRGFDDYVKNYLRRKRDINEVSPEELATL